MKPVIITAALTGPIAGKVDNPNLPVSPEEIAASAAGAAAAGAAVVHVHLRDAAGNPTADLDVARRTLDLIGESCDALVQLSTGVGLGVPFEDRARLVETRPRMATLNVCSMTFGRNEFLNPPANVDRLAYRMGELGVKPELEIYDTGHLEVALSLLERGLIEEPLQFSLVMGVHGGMPATLETFVDMRKRMPEAAIWQVIAIGRANLPITTVGLAAGTNARTGMEDTLYRRRGELAQSNAELVEGLANIARVLERPLATPAEAELAIALSPAGAAG